MRIPEEVDRLQVTGTEAGQSPWLVDMPLGAPGRDEFPQTMELKPRKDSPLDAVVTIIVEGYLGDVLVARNQKTEAFEPHKTKVIRIPLTKGGGIECEGDEVRECYSGPPGTEGIGLCRTGIERCVDAYWSGTCEGEVTPSEEACDGEDNDCNGEADEEPEATASCDDLNPCTSDSCDETTGACENLDVADGTTCDDGLWCNGVATCQSGVCTEADPPDCDDGNPCTDDLCDETTDQCDHQSVQDGTLCDDGLYCTVDTQCTSGVCEGNPRDCSIVEDPRNGSRCDETQASCVPDPLSTGTLCDDQAFCTVTDACLNGDCVGQPRDCADTVTCTDDSCDETLDQCLNVLNDLNCDDGDVCTTDTCTTSGCVNVVDKDTDGDGFIDVLCEGGNDCDDNDSSINPNAAEVPCDDIDQDCNGLDAGTFAKLVSEVQVSSSAGQQGDLDMVWTGTGYGLAWEDFRDSNWEIYFNRTDPNGQALGADSRLTSDVAQSVDPSLTWTGSEYGLAWRESADGNPEIYLLVLDSSGVATSPLIRITNDVANSRRPSLVWNGSEFGLTWMDRRDGNEEIYFVTLDASGNKLLSDTRVTNDGFGSFSPDIAWSGSAYGIVWIDERSGGPDIYFAEVLSDGTKPGSDARITSAPGNRYFPQVVWSGSEYLACWRDDRNGNDEIYCARIAPGGSKIGTDIRVTADPGSSSKVSVAFNGIEYGLAWADNRATGQDIYFARISADGAIVTNEIAVTGTDAIGPTAAVIVWTGTEYGIAWLDSYLGTPVIYFTRVGCQP